MRGLVGNQQLQTDLERRRTLGLTRQLAGELVEMFKGIILLSSLILFGLCLCAWLSIYHHVFDVIGNVLLQALQGAAILAPVALVARARLALIFFVLSIASGAGLILASSRLERLSPDAPTTSVMQFNMFGNNFRLSDVQDLIAAEDADITVLVEARRLSKARLLADQTTHAELDQTDRHLLKAFVKSNAPAFMHQFIADVNSPIALDLFSKTPLDEKQTIGSPLGYSLAITLVDTPSGKVRIAAFHLARPWPFTEPHLQRMQARALAQELGFSPYPTLLLGDCNCVPWGQTAKEIAKLTGLTPKMVLFGGTWPSRVPFDQPWGRAWPTSLSIPIDNVFADSRIVIGNRKVLQHSTGSDHRPVSFDFQIAKVSDTNTDLS